MLILAGMVVLGPHAVYAADPTPVVFTASVRTVRVDFFPTDACAGVDKTASPVAIMAPKLPGVTKARADINPTTQFSRIAFVSDDPTVATVNPPAAQSANQELLVSGGPQVTGGTGYTFIRARTPTSSKLKRLSAYGRPRRDVHIGIHAITQLNDDVQVTAKDSGPGPNFVCITGSPDLHSTKVGNDVIDGNTIKSGSDGICSSIATGGDTQVIAQLHSYPCISPGLNEKLDSVRAVGDLENGEYIETGADGICNSDLDNSPKDVPTAGQLVALLDVIWGRQTNIHFTVSRTDAVLNYDLNHDRALTDMNQAGDAEINDEIDVISQAANPTAIFDIYYVRELQNPSEYVGFALSDSGEVFIGDQKEAGSLGNLTSHELGHLFDLNPTLPMGHSLNAADLMWAYEKPNGTQPCELRLSDWERAWSKVD